MDTHYNWSDSAFKNRAGESLNLAVNAVADVLHAFSTNAVVISEFPGWVVVLPSFLFVVLIAVMIRRQRWMT